PTHRTADRVRYGKAGAAKTQLQGAEGTIRTAWHDRTVGSGDRTTAHGDGPARLLSTRRPTGRRGTAAAEGSRSTIDGGVRTVGRVGRLTGGKRAADEDNVIRTAHRSCHLRRLSIR